MPLACLHFGKLSSNTKTITRYRKLSVKLDLRGMLKTGSPGILLLSAPASRISALHEAVTAVRETGARDVDLYYGKIEPLLSVNFTKQNGVKRVKDIGRIVDECAELGVGGDVVKWIRDGVEKRRPLWRLEEFQKDKRRPVLRREEAIRSLEGADPLGRGPLSRDIPVERERDLLAEMNGTMQTVQNSPIIRPRADWALPAKADEGEAVRQSPIVRQKQEEEQYRLVRNGLISKRVPAAEAKAWAEANKSTEARRESPIVRPTQERLVRNGLISKRVSLEEMEASKTDPIVRPKEEGKAPISRPIEPTEEEKQQGYRFVKSGLVTRRIPVY
jgi:hypothetical protein